MRKLLLFLLFLPAVGLAQTPFAPVAQTVAIVAPNGSSSSSTALPGAFTASTLQVYNSTAVPITWTFSRVPGGATASSTSTIVPAGITEYFYIGSGVFDVAVYGVGGTGTVYLQAGNGGYFQGSGIAAIGSITTGHCPEFVSSSLVQDSGAACGGGSMVYPSAGIANSTGTAWGTSYSVSGSGNVALTTSPTLATPILTGYATASLPTCNAASKGSLAYTTDGTPAFTFCNGTSWVNNGGTQFTYAATGCTPSAASGDATGGSITLAAGPCTSIVVTFNGAVGMTAPHMWVCSVNDQTLQNAGTWFGSWGQSASTTTTATIPIPSAAGSTDVITFNCIPH